VGRPNGKNATPPVVKRLEYFNPAAPSVNKQVRRGINTRSPGVERSGEGIAPRPVAPLSTNVRGLGVKRSEGTGKYEILLDWDPPEAWKAEDYYWRSVKEWEQSSRFYAPVKTHILPPRLGFEANHLISPDISAFSMRHERSYEALMDNIYYLGPLRAVPRRDYRWTGSGRYGVGDQGQFTMDAILKASQRGWQSQPTDGQSMPFQESIAYWLKKLGLVDSFEVREIRAGSKLFEAVVKQSPSAPEANLVDVGFGVSQILPVLVLLYYVPEGSIILMEQPEIHLHPSAQSGLADVILSASLQRGIQVVVESHSEHLLRRLQRRVAEGDIQGTPVAASDARLYFVESEDHEAKLNSLKLNEFGGIENWPEDFFGDEMGEMAAIHRAGLLRRKKAAER